MCGIVGIVTRRPHAPERLSRLVHTMADSLVHRGPDAEGFFVRPDVALGVRRLAIIDVARGHQPFLSPDGSRVLVFNGEIYNHRALRRELEQTGRPFATDCDTEVALAAIGRWGASGIERLQGMFGLAHWDDREKRLLLARDWFGQKSIYYAETELGLVFASEIKALLASKLVERGVDLEALSHYMTLRCLPGASTLFTGISKLPAAHRMVVDAETRMVERYWRPRYEPKWQQGEGDLLDELDALFDQVVHEHLMSEVPLGAFLSGGIDSSLVVAYASRYANGLRTFSVGVDEASQSELPFARLVAQRYDTRHLETIVEPELARHAPAMVAALEEPVDPFAAGVYIVSQVTARHVTVALGGDGGDELFAGYDRYLGQALARVYARIPATLRHRVLRPVFRRIPESFGYKSLAAKLSWLDRMADLRGVDRYAESVGFLRFPHGLKEALFTGEAWKQSGALESARLLDEHFQDGSASAFLDRILHTDCMTRLADHLLPSVDRMSMAHSLEVRCPFLDRRLAELAMRMPVEWKLKHRRLKYIARRLAERHLPSALVYRPKQGFGFPLGLWLRGPLAPLLCRTIQQSRFAEVGIFQRAEMVRLLDEHIEGRVDHSYRLWMLFNLEIWYRHFIDREASESLQRWIESAAERAA